MPRNHEKELTWGEFKRAVESRPGITEETEIGFIDMEGSNYPAVELYQDGFGMNITDGESLHADCDRCDRDFIPRNGETTCPSCMKTMPAPSSGT